MMLRAPRLSELIAFICRVQPELDEAAAKRILLLDPCILEGIAQDFVQQRDRAESLLELHLSLEGVEAA